MRRAPAVAHRPIGPCANTTTASPMRTGADSAPLKPVDAMSASRTTCSSLSSSGIVRQVRLRVRHQEVLGLRAVDRVAEAPAADRLVAAAVSALRPLRRQAGPALAARRDRADQDALADGEALTPAPSSSMTPTGSCPITRPGRTGYSPRTMCRSVPQIVVSVMRITASPGPGWGRGTSSMPNCPTPWNTFARIVAIARVLRRMRATQVRCRAPAHDAAPAPPSRPERAPGAIRKLRDAASTRSSAELPSQRRSPGIRLTTLVTKPRVDRLGPRTLADQKGRLP